jgi:hypothetical protein
MPGGSDYPRRGKVIISARPINLGEYPSGPADLSLAFFNAIHLPRGNILDSDKKRDNISSTHFNPLDFGRTAHE